MFPNKALTIATILVLILPAASALEQETTDKLINAGQTLNDYIERYENAETDKYNRIIFKIRDQEGNPVDCNVRIYYNDYKQEEFTTENGNYNAVLNHGRTFPPDILSIYLGECPCWPTTIEKEGPTFPGVNEHMERIREIVEEDVQDQASELAQDQAEKVLEKVFTGLGFSAKAASNAMTGFSIGAELGQPIHDYIMRKVGEIFDAVRERERIRHEVLGETSPQHPNTNLITKGMFSGLWEYVAGEHDAFTKFEVDVTVACREGHEANYRYDHDWYEPEDYEPEEEEPRQPTQPEEEETEEQEPEEDDTGDEQPEQEDEQPETTEEPEQEEEREPDCDICDPVLEEIERKEAQLERAQNRLDNAQDNLGDVNEEMPEAENDLEEAEERLERFNNPDSWVESEGERYTGTDLRVEEAAMKEAWNKYASGEWSAQELEEYWENFDSEDLERLKEEAREGLERDVEEAEQRLEELRDRKEELEQEVQELEQRIQDLQEEISRLEEQYQDCLDRCRAGEQVDLEADYGIREERRGFFGWLRNLFRGERPVPQEENQSAEENQTTENETREEEPEERDDYVPEEGVSKNLTENETYDRTHPGQEDNLTPEVQDAEEPETPEPEPEPEPECPRGTIEGETSCQEECEGRGECSLYTEAGDKQCYQCRPYQCPDNTIPDQSSCEEQCTYGECVVAAEKDSFQCWGCEFRCDRYCESKGQLTSRPDYSEHIKSELEEVSCVKAAYIQWPSGYKANDCQCYPDEPPEVTFSEERIVCEDTACGDVACGETAECVVGDTRYTVDCSWGGWKQVSPNQFVPVVGSG